MGFTPVNSAVPFPFALTVRVAVFLAKFAVTVAVEPCSPVRVTVVDAAAGFAMVAKPEVTVQLTK
jgi:hypothetical protein